MSCWFLTSYEYSVDFILSFCSAEDRTCVRPSALACPSTSAAASLFPSRCTNAQFPAPCFARTCHGTYGRLKAVSALTDVGRAQGGQSCPRCLFIVNPERTLPSQHSPAKSLRAQGTVSSSCRTSINTPGGGGSKVG